MLGYGYKIQIKKGSVGALADTLKQFENIREFFASATLTSLIDVPFAFIFLLVIYMVGGWLIAPVIIAIVLNSCSDPIYSASNEGTI